MKGDFTRSTFRRHKHYNSVRMQQGRVQLDSDWNEQVDIFNDRSETSLADLIGPAGAPADSAGFTISGGAGLRIGAGHFYVDGILVENETDNLDFTRQPETPNLNLPNNAGDYQIYLDVFTRHITALEDPEIREVALGAPDTSTRTRWAWQVRWSPVNLANGQDRCAQPLPGQPTGQMRTRANPGSVARDACDVPSGGGYRRLENQLYRVEIHEFRAGRWRFKWSRDNGSVVTAWLSQNGADLTVAGTGPDRYLGFSSGQTVELTDDAHELNRIAGVLVHLADAEGQIMTVTAADAALVNKNNFPDQINGLDNHPKIRRWDSDGTLEVSSGWIPLEDGVEVSFRGDATQESDFLVGDYWLIPARTNTGNVEWPRVGNTPQFQAPHGVHHHLARLAVVRRDAGGNFTLLQDCRALFPPLTRLISLRMLGGDGQETLPGAPMARPLRVGVMMGSMPLNNDLFGYRVLFTASHNGVMAQVSGGTDIITNPLAAGQTRLEQSIVNGVASVAWQPANDLINPVQFVTATLVRARVGAEGSPVAGIPPLTFNGSLSLASRVHYVAGACDPLSNVTTVQEALDTLCGIRENRGECCIAVGENGEFPTLDEALDRLRERLEQFGVRSICLCLLPGEHVITRPHNLDWTDFRGVHLAIRSMSRAAVELRDSLRFAGLASLTISGLDFTVQDHEGQLLAELLLEEIQLVRIENCTFFSSSWSSNIDRTMLAILTEGEVTVRDCRFNVSRRWRDSVVGGAFEGTVLGDALNNAVRRFSMADMRAGVGDMVRTELNTMRRSTRTGISERVNTFVETRGSDISNTARARLARLSNTIGRVRDETFDAELAEIIVEILEEAEPGRALFLSGREGAVLLEDNVILGTLYLYGEESDARAVTEKQEKTLIQAIQTGKVEGIKEYPLSHSVFQMRGCTLTKVSLSQDAAHALIRAMIEQQEDTSIVEQYYGDMALSDNRFMVDRNIVLAQNMHLQGNVFARESSFVALFLAENGIYTGNRGSGNDALIFHSHLLNAKAANLRLNFDNF